ncbi:MAG: nuclear transport factor 2 family protein [Sphingopyxis sp.]|nr:nuclear transport factor 2 family protein [Sphingopyxis sp.]
MSDPVAVVEALVAAFNRRDSAAIADLLAEDIVCAGIPLDPAHGRAATMDMLAPFLAAEAVDWRILAIAANDRIVFTERDDRFRFVGQDWTSVRAAGVFEIDGDGRIVAWRDYFDLAELERALP